MASNHYNLEKYRNLCKYRVKLSSKWYKKVRVESYSEYNIASLYKSTTILGYKVRGLNINLVSCFIMLMKLLYVLGLLNVNYRYISL